MSEETALFLARNLKILKFVNFSPNVFVVFFLLLYFPLLYYNLQISEEDLKERIK